MPILNRAAELQAEATAWRRHLHQHPEILYEVENTAAFVTERLRAFGVDEIATGIGRTGVVGLIRGRKPGSRVIGLRADMAAPQLTEGTGKPLASTMERRLHARRLTGHLYRPE